MYRGRGTVKARLCNSAQKVESEKAEGREGGWKTKVSNILRMIPFPLSSNTLHRSRGPH